MRGSRAANLSEGMSSCERRRRVDQAADGISAEGVDDGAEEASSCLSDAEDSTYENECHITKKDDSPNVRRTARYL